MIYPDHLVINATRYAIGRMTYTVEETVSWLIAHWDEIDTQAQRVVARDVAEAINEDDRNRLDRELSGFRNLHLLLGPDCYREQWDRLAVFFASRGVKVGGT